MPWISFSKRSGRQARSRLDQTSQSGQGFRITDVQRELAGTGQVQAFWESRLAVGDPVARAGLRSLGIPVGFVDSVPGFDYLFGGTSINNRLQAFSRAYTGHALDIDEVRVRLMAAHVRAVDFDMEGVVGLLNPRQVAEYHHVVFREFGLPPTAFGGTPFTGYLGEADNWLYTWVWCGGCDE